MRLSPEKTIPEIKNKKSHESLFQVCLLKNQLN